MGPVKVFLFGDIVLPTGFGRIAAQIGRHLTARGYQVLGACIQYDGLLPQPLPFFVAGLAGKDGGMGPMGLATTAARQIAAFQPDVVISIQDFPYHEALHGQGVDWSQMCHVVITPVDGVPVYPKWLQLVDQLDGFMTISEFGVEAFRQAGKRASLCPPGVDTNEFFRLPDEKRGELRDRLHIPRDGFVVGVFAMNQGRKSFPAMVEGFHEAFRDVPNAYLYLDCEKVGAGGWDIPQSIMLPVGLDPTRVRFREDALQAQIGVQNERYNLLDLHMVIAHREGFGLPHIEAMGTGIPSVTMNYCSGAEIIGLAGERGWLVAGTKAEYGTWGGALDYNADIPDLAAKLRDAYDHPAERIARGARALDWVKRERTWERCVLAVEDVVKAAVEKRKPDLERKYQIAMPAPQQVMIPQMPAGQTFSININAPVHIVANNPQEFADALIGQAPQPVMLVEAVAERKDGDGQA